MSKINKIKLSGTTYDVEDANASKTVELTQAQYDALVQAGTVDPNTFYIITDAQAVDLSEYWTSGQTQSAIDSAVSGKADYSAATVSMFGTETISSSQTAQSIVIIFPYTDGVYYISGGSSNMFSITSDFWIGYNDVDDNTWKSLSINNTGDTSAYTFTLTNDYFYFQTKGINRVRNLRITLGESATVAFTYKRWADVEVAASTVIEETILPELSGKQDTLSAGTGIDITNNVISATGGGGGINSVAAEYDDTGSDGEFLINVNSGQSYSQIFKVGSGLTVTEDGNDVILSATGGGGGGKAVSGGTNISVTTGETADTINCTIPAFFHSDTVKGDIEIGSNDGVNSDYGRLVIGRRVQSRGNPYFQYSIGIGVQPDNSNKYCQLYGQNSVGIGRGFKIGSDSLYSNGIDNAIAIGHNATSRNDGDIALGANATASGNSSVAIGSGSTADGAEYKMNLNNQIKVTPSNQVYIYNKDNTEMICLQDQLGGGVTVDQTIISGSTNAVAGGAVYSQFGGLKLVKLTQTEYDNLGTKDSNTLYVITTS